MSQYTTTPARRRYVRELPAEERPFSRLKQVGSRGVSTAELLAMVLNTADALELAEDVLAHTGGLHNLGRFTAAELSQIRGIGEGKAAVLLSLAEIGRRMTTRPYQSRPRVLSPADAAHLLMADMMDLEQEHVRLVLLDTRNFVISTPTVYVGNVNTVVVKSADIFRYAVRENACAFILAHNHPTGDPSPSPEDVNITKHLFEAGKLMDCELLDHVIIGRHRFVSLKERGVI